ncbi:hypothetical protein D3C81_2262960 [compost metagenome]
MAVLFVQGLHALVVEGVAAAFEAGDLFGQFVQTLVILAHGRQQGDRLRRQGAALDGDVG